MTKERFPQRGQHEDRKDLIGEHPLGDIGQIIILFIFIAIWVVDSFILKFSTFISNYVPFYFRLSLGIIILSVSAYLARSGLRTVFCEIREKPNVIRKGVFSIVRHPIYLSAILLYLGLLFFTISILATVVWIIIIVFYIYISRYEEKLLTQRFGKMYEDYMKDVPMLLPRIGRTDRK